MNRSTLCLALLWLASTGSAHAQAWRPGSGQGRIGGGGMPPSSTCVTDEEWARARRSVADSEHTVPLATVIAPEKFTFYPLAGTLYRDLFIWNFVDLDPSASVLDWDCTDLSYNGHDATDTTVRTFGEQAIGVPVFAALDGTVVATHDGEVDMHTACSGTANSVIINHGAGRVCYYWHLRNGSVQVTPGQVVKAGQQLGLAASSGCSTYPHLHFATYDNGVLVEPYAGACRPGPSQWVDQTPIERGMYLADFNVTDVDISTYPGLPFDMPRTGTFVLGQQNVRFWLNVINQPAASTWRIRLRRPDNTIAFDSGTVGFGNAGFYRWAWWWWSYTFALNQIGTWHILCFINGTPAGDAPFDVVATQGEVVNRAPYPVTVRIEPPAPSEADVLICRVQTDLILDDPDYDIVRYHYVWIVNGSIVRDVVTAALSDVFPRGTAHAGSVVSCAVTPMDESDSTTTAIDSVIIRAAPASKVHKP